MGAPFCPGYRNVPLRFVSYIRKVPIIPSLSDCHGDTIATWSQCQLVFSSLQAPLVAAVFNQGDYNQWKRMPQCDQGHQSPMRQRLSLWPRRLQPMGEDLSVWPRRLQPMREGLSLWPRGLEPIRQGFSLWPRRLQPIREGLSVWPRTLQPMRWSLSVWPLTKEITANGRRFLCECRTVQ